MRFYTANILSALIWARALVLFGDQLAQLLGQENLATKILYGALAAAAVTVLRSIDAAHYEKIAIVERPSPHLNENFAWPRLWFGNVFAG
jgi:membrane protein DedA with SNARE-associated domain